MRPLTTYTLSGLRKPSAAHTSIPDAPPLSSPKSPREPFSPKFKLLKSKKDSAFPLTTLSGIPTSHPPSGPSTQRKLFANSRKNTPGWFLRLLLRTLQFTLGLTVVGVFGTRIHNDSVHHAAQATQWVYALSVGSLASLTVLVYMFPFTEALLAFVAMWDALITFLYIVAFGIFATMYEGRDGSVKEQVKGQVLETREYQHAVWVLLINVFLGLVSGLLSAVKARQADMEKKRLVAAGV